MAFLLTWLKASWGIMSFLLIQMASPALVFAGLLMPVGLVEGRGLGVSILALLTLLWVICKYGNYIGFLPLTRQITQNENPYLYGVASDQAQLAGLAMPRVVESPFFTASANGRAPWDITVIVSANLQKTLTRQELGAVLAHEIAHVKQGDPLSTLIIVTVVAFILGVSLLIGLSGWIGLVALLLTILSFHREFRADSNAAKVGVHSIPLATALKKLPGSSFFSFLCFPFTHPPTNLRVWRLKGLAKRSV